MRGNEGSTPEMVPLFPSEAATRVDKPEPRVWSACLFEGAQSPFWPAPTDLAPLVPMILPALSDDGRVIPASTGRG